MVSIVVETKVWSFEAFRLWGKTKRLTSILIARKLEYYAILIMELITEIFAERRTHIFLLFIAARPREGTLHADTEIAMSVAKNLSYRWEAFVFKRLNFCEKRKEFDLN